MNTKMTEQDVSEFLKLMKPWIAQDPGLDLADYGNDRRAYFQELRTINKQGAQARKALRQAFTFQPNPEALEHALTRFSGRLTYDEKENGYRALSYCTGQYWPTEYRLAAAVVLEDYVETCRPKYQPVAGFDPCDIDDIKQAAKAAGSHRFDKDTLRFFRGRVLPTIYKGQGGVFFVSSEQYVSYSTRRTEPRRYTVRRFDPVTAEIDTVGEFNKMSRGQAIRAARQAADSQATVAA